MPQWLYLFRLISAIWTGQNLYSSLATSLYKKVIFTKKLSYKVLSPQRRYSILHINMSSYGVFQSLIITQLTGDLIEWTCLDFDGQNVPLFTSTFFHKMQDFREKTSSTGSIYGLKMCRGHWCTHTAQMSNIIRMVTFEGGNITECSYHGVCSSRDL